MNREEHSARGYGARLEEIRGGRGHGHEREPEIEEERAQDDHWTRREYFDESGRGYSEGDMGVEEESEAGETESQVQNSYLLQHMQSVKYPNSARSQSILREGSRMQSQGAGRDTDRFESRGIAEVSEWTRSRSGSRQV